MNKTRIIIIVGAIICMAGLLALTYELFGNAGIIVHIASQVIVGVILMLRPVYIAHTKVISALDAINNKD
jgi:hypothetical protein